MSNQLKAQAWEQGHRQALQRLALGMSKSAAGGGWLSKMFGGAAAAGKTFAKGTGIPPVIAHTPPPLPSVLDDVMRQMSAPGQRDRELISLGEKLYRQATDPDTAMGGLKAVMLPGYGRTQTVKTLLSQLEDARNAKLPLSAYKGQEETTRQAIQKVMREMGEEAEPKMRFWNHTMPMAAMGTGGLGLGALGGGAYGAFQQQRNVEDRLRNMPLWDRMKYLVLPNSLKTRPTLPSYER
jgi:hypothetical protein